MPVHLSGDLVKWIKSSLFQENLISQLSKMLPKRLVQNLKQIYWYFWKSWLFFCSSTEKFKCYGRSGYLVTNDKIIADKIKLLRNHGIKNRNDIVNFGYVSRMDNFQAGILNLRLNKLKSVIARRRNNAKLYFKNLKNLKHIVLPHEEKNQFNTFHTFIILAKNRNKLKKYLEKKFQQLYIIQN